MILTDNETSFASGQAAGQDQSSEPAVIRFARLFKRDLWCWVNALQKLWWLFAIFPMLFAAIFFFFRTMTTSSVYVANCGLIRQEVTDTRSGILPPGYVNVQKSIIMNLFKSRAVLEETVKRLSLPYTAEQLFNNIEVKSEKNSDYFAVSAKSKDPTIAATLANTLSDVFIDEYKKLIRKNLEDLNDSYVRTQNDLEKQLADQTEKLKNLSAENNLTTIESDIGFNNQRLLYVEDQLTKTSSTLDSAKQALYELQGELANTEEEVVTHRERSTAAEDELTRARATLHSYEQIYAKSNPILVQQRQFVKRLEEALEKNQAEEETENDVNSKVVISRNPAYTQLQVAIAAKRAEITALNNDMKLNNDIAVQLRARRELLTRIYPTIRQIEADIEQCKEQINRSKLQIVTIRNFLDRSFSDISIQELAKAPTVPLGRKRGVWAAIGFVLGSFIASLILFGSEFFTLTIRSNVDIEDALRIKSLGMIPVLDQAHRANYYSALQTMISNGEEFFSRDLSKADGSMLIVFAPNKRADIDEKTREEFCETLKIRLGWNYVIVSPLTDEEFDAKQTPKLINDYLYQFTDEPPKPGKDQTVYFRLDDLSFISPPTDEQINRVKKAFKSAQVIVWDLFEFELHRQLFAEIARNADLTVIPMKYGQTSKLPIYRILQFLKSFHVQNIVGLLYQVNNKHYSKVTL